MPKTRSQKQREAAIRRRTRTESFGYQTPFLVSRRFEKYERAFVRFYVFFFFE
jgi:hypothetical protein